MSLTSVGHEFDGDARCAAPDAPEGRRRFPAALRRWCARWSDARRHPGGTAVATGEAVSEHPGQRGEYTTPDGPQPAAGPPAGGPAVLRFGRRPGRCRPSPRRRTRPAPWARRGRRPRRRRRPGRPSRPVSRRGREDRGPPRPDRPPSGVRSSCRAAGRTPTAPTRRARCAARRRARRFPRPTPPSWSGGRTCRPACGGDRRTRRSARWTRRAGWRSPAGSPSPGRWGAARRRRGRPSTGSHRWRLPPWPSAPAGSPWRCGRWCRPRSDRRSRRPRSRSVTGRPRPRHPPR